MKLPIRTRNAASIALLVILSPVALYLWHRRLHPSNYSIPSRGGTSMVVTNILTQPYYLQIDSRWKDEIIGHSATRMSDAGCTVCCVSMAFTQLGTPIDPKTLNSDLTRRNGYTSAGLLKWNVAAEVSNNTLSFDLPDKPAYMTIDSAIQSGNPVIAKIALWESYPHWVLIVGKDGYEYLVKDPLCERQTIEKLSSVSKTIQSIRVVKRKYQ